MQPLLGLSSPLSSRLPSGRYRRHPHESRCRRPLSISSGVPSLPGPLGLLMAVVLSGLLCSVSFIEFFIIFIILVGLEFSLV